MANPISSYLDVHSTALTLREQRMKLIASNLTNADTPGYKSQDIHFEDALRQATGMPNGLQMNLTNPAHQSQNGDGSVQGFMFEREGIQPSMDGNTVDPDIERAAFGRAALEYRASLGFVESKVRSMMTAITGQ